MTCITLHIAME